MTRTKKYLTIYDLEVGMRVEVYYRYSSERRNGLVVGVMTGNHGIMIDGKPVQAKKNNEVKIAYEDSDEQLVLTVQNFNHYQITRL